MRKLLISGALYALANIVGFFALKHYSDIRQVRVVSATLESTVEIAAIGPIISRIPYVKLRGNKVIEVGYHYRRTGFGQMNSATGVFVSNDGLILTCYHAARGSQLVQVSLNGFKSDMDAERPPRPVFAYVLGTDETHDLALLRVIRPGQWFRGVALRNSVEKGLPVFTIGFPAGFEKHVTAGVVSSFDDESDEEFTVTDVVMEHGSSGGGLFDADGRLLGLADSMFYPSDIPSFQGFSKFTNLDAMRALVEKYDD